MSKIWKKPVIITQAGVVSHHKRNDKGVAKSVHHKSQANFYRGLFNVVNKNSKVKGIFWGDWVADSNFGGDKDISLSPQLKEAELVLREEFGGVKELPKVEIKTGGDKEEVNRMYCKWCPDDVDL